MEKQKYRVKVPGWLKTVTKYYIHENPQGKTLYKRDDKNTGAKKPGWLKTATKYYISKKPQGKTMYKRDNPGNFVGHIGLVLDVKQKNSTKTAAEIESIVSFVHLIMQQYSQDKRYGPNILDYLESKETKRGLYNHFIQ